MANGERAIPFSTREDNREQQFKEVWVEEQAHAIAPELSERIVRGTVVPEIMRRSRR